MIAGSGTVNTIYGGFVAMSGNSAVNNGMFLMLACSKAVDNGGDSFSVVRSGAADGSISGENGGTAIVAASAVKRQGHQRSVRGNVFH